MELKYYKDTDSLYIDLLEHQSTESKEISEGIVLDFDATGRMVGIDNASNKVALEKLTVSSLPGTVETDVA
jgi:uncharacterized protein YuzE|tara:strand:- start:160 stop:372 length:213 start_codon:yes stop_codon:yes gene_type:complete